MPNVWAILPSALPYAKSYEVLQAWRDMGYKLAIQHDLGKESQGFSGDFNIERPFYGWAEAINHLQEWVFEETDSDWVVAIGDDCMPDLSHSAYTIATECTNHFKLCQNCKDHALPVGGCPFCEFVWRDRTFGVMNPTGDRYGGGYIDGSAAHPWLGREWCRRMYQGNGPLWPEYKFWYSDTELQDVAIQHGVFWQRRDLTQEHKHYTRHGGQPPEHTKRRMHFVNEDKALYEARKALGFPGSAPLEL
jgi:hypothetical protein